MEFCLCPRLQFIGSWQVLLTFDTWQDGCLQSGKLFVNKNHVIKQKDFTQKVATTESSKFRTNFQSTNKLQPIKMCYVDLLYIFVHFLDQHVPKTFKSFVWPFQYICTPLRHAEMTLTLQFQAEYFVGFNTLKISFLHQNKFFQNKKYKFRHYVITKKNTKRSGWYSWIF